MALTVSVNEIVANSNNPVLRGRPGWKTVRLGEVASIQNGGPFDSALFSKSEGHPLIRIRDITRSSTETRFNGEFDQCYAINSGDLLVGMDGDFNCARWKGPQGLLNQRVCCIRLKSSEYDARFLDHVLPSFLKAINDATSSVTVKHLSSRTVADIPLPWPPIDVQRAIAGELDKQFSRLDEAVAGLRRVKANLKRYRASILDSVFDAEPDVCLGDLIESGPQNGLYLPKTAYGTGTPMLRIDDYQTNWMRPIGELRRVTATDVQVETWALREGDLVVNRVNSMSHLGKCACIPASLAGALFESNMMRFRLKPHASPRYVELYLAGTRGKTRLTQYAKWAVNQASINQLDLKATRLPLPPLPEQHRIVAEVDRLLSIAREAEAEVEANLKRTQGLRQAILAQAFQPVAA